MAVSKQGELESGRQCVAVDCRLVLGDAFLKYTTSVQIL